MSGTNATMKYVCCVILDASFHPTLSVTTFQKTRCPQHLPIRVRHLVYHRYWYRQDAVRERTLPLHQAIGRLKPRGVVRRPGRQGLYSRIARE